MVEHREVLGIPAGNQDLFGVSSPNMEVSRQEVSHALAQRRLDKALRNQSVGRFLLAIEGTTLLIFKFSVCSEVYWGNRRANCAPLGFAK